MIDGVAELSDALTVFDAQEKHKLLHDLDAIKRDLDRTYSDVEAIPSSA